MNRSAITAVLITAGAVAWVLSGQLGNGTTPPDGAPPTATEVRPEPPLQSVRVARLTARPMVDAVVLQGRTEAWRAVDVRAEVRGRVDAVLVDKGQPVTAGAVVVRLAVDDRKAVLDQARALLAQRRIEHDAAAALHRRGNASDVQLATARANLDAAEAAVRRAEIDLERTAIRVPFDGVLDRRPVHLGDYVDVGDVVASVVDLDPLRIVGFATEANVAQLRVGASGHALIVGAREVEGRVAYVAAQADAATRTFRVELEVPNPDHRLVSGLTAQLRLPLHERLAHFVSPSALSLADDGSIGVKVVDAADTVRFLPVTILGTAPDGIWLGGLPPDIRLIIIGHDYVAAGNRVKPVEMEQVGERP